MSNSSEKLRALRRSASIGRVLRARELEEYDTKKDRQERREKIKALARDLVVAKKRQ